MPFAIHRGQRIHYSVAGQGPLVVLQHGLLLNGDSWKHGVVDALASGYRVACVDSLGHGLSDKPADPELYSQRQRSGDAVAVIDHLGAGSAHLIGHSVGAWAAVGVARYFRARLRSLVLGGWDFVGGLPKTSQGPVSYQGFMKFAARMTPELVAQVTPESEPGIRACFDRLGELDGAAEAVSDAGVPVLVWEGRDDPAHDRRKALAETFAAEFLSTPGDHLGMVLAHGATSGRGIRAFLDRAEVAAADS